MNRSVKSLACAVVAAVPFFAAGSADARSNYPGLIPNGRENNCLTCHGRAAGGDARNSFGLDVEANIDRVGVFGADTWGEICDLDSDEDGQTNGEELGDPDCVWTSGAAARTTDISFPGDGASTSADPTGGAAAGGEGEGEGEGEGSGGGGDDGGCGSSAQAAALLPGLLLLRRRRAR